MTMSYPIHNLSSSNTNLQLPFILPDVSPKFLLHLFQATPAIRIPSLSTLTLDLTRGFCQGRSAKRFVRSFFRSSAWGSSVSAVEICQEFPWRILGESMEMEYLWVVSGEFLLFSARCCLVCVHSFIFIFVLYYDVLITNSCDCWVSISGSGVDASFLPNRKNRNGTLKPWNLLLGCKARLIEFYGEMRSECRGTILWFCQTIEDHVRLYWEEPPVIELSKGNIHRLCTFLHCLPMNKCFFSPASHVWWLASKSACGFVR
jgi:hypothetical protein